MTRVPIGHINAAGRFDQSPQAFGDSLDHYRTLADVITVTEVDRNARARLLDSKTWAGIWGDRSPRDDCGITWNTHTARKVWAGTLPLSHRTYVNERGNRTGITAAAFAVLDHDGARVVWGSAHTPHGMQDELRRDRVRTDVGRAYVSITDAYLRRGLALAQTHAADAIVLSADMNLNLRAAWVRAWFAAYRIKARLHLNWRQPYPHRGTHGTELIDATLYRGLTLTAPPRLLPPAPGDDHTAYLEEFTP